MRLCFPVGSCPRQALRALAYMDGREARGCPPSLACSGGGRRGFIQEPKCFLDGSEPGFLVERCAPGCTLRDLHCPFKTMAVSAAAREHLKCGWCVRPRHVAFQCFYSKCRLTAAVFDVRDWLSAPPTPSHTHTSHTCCKPTSLSLLRAFVPVFSSPDLLCLPPSGHAPTLQPCLMLPN